jgi:hypothetical protein
MMERIAVPNQRQLDDALREAKVEEITSGYRYPGSAPFADSDTDRELFRGRREEIDDVLHSILSVDLFVVYAISGVGKTSLLTAGVLEPLRQRQFFPVVLRLNDPTCPPVALIEGQIRSAADKADGIKVERHPSVRDVVPTTLWDLLGGLEVWRNNTLQQLVLIFDQFEELFTLDWSDDQRDEFIQQLGDVVRRHVAQPERERGSQLPPPDVKITLIIREDSLGELEALAAHVPQILRHRFRLGGLSPAQAQAAIREPAALDDARLVTRRFSYSDDATQAILDFLRARESGRGTALSRSIDPSQLQIICQHVERSIVPSKRSDGDSDSTVAISEADFGGHVGLERILRDFYRNELAAFPSRQRVLVRHLCERGLINRSGRRLSLEEGQICAEFGLTKPMLAKLVDRRLLRAEPRVGSVYYELAHDTLTAPILAHRDEVRSARRRRWRRVLVGALGLGLAAAVALVLALRSDSSETGNDSSATGVETIAVGESVSGTIESDSPRSVYSFEPEGGRPLIVEVKPEDRLDAVLEVRYPDGLEQQVDAGGGGATETVIVTVYEAGNHRVNITGFRSSGDFELSIHPATVVDLAVGDDESGGIEPTVPGGVFAFEASQGEAVAVEVVPDESLDVLLTVIDPDGRPLQEDASAQGESELVIVDGSTAGRHLVVVSGADPSAKGEYELSIDPVDVVDVAVGTSVPGKIDAAKPYGVFAFEASADRLLAVEVVPDVSLDTVLNVVDPDGVHRSADAGADGGIEVVGVPGSPAGRHLVIVTGFMSAEGEYDLSIRPVNPVDLAIGTTVTGTLDAARPYGVFAFEAPAGQPLVVEVEPTETLDVVLEVFDPNGSPQEADVELEGGTESVDVDGSVAGRHVVLVTDFFGMAEGEYAVSVRPG